MCRGWAVSIGAVVADLTGLTSFSPFFFFFGFSFFFFWGCRCTSDKSASPRPGDPVDPGSGSRSTALPQHPPISDSTMAMLSALMLTTDGGNNKLRSTLLLLPFALDN